MADHNPEADDKAELTGVGCILTLLSVGVILGLAVVMVQWRDPETGKALPRTVAIAVPFLVGAVFHGICTVLLQLVGVRIWSKSKKDEAGEPGASATGGSPGD